MQKTQKIKKGGDRISVYISPEIYVELVADDSPRRYKFIEIDYFRDPLNDNPSEDSCEFEIINWEPIFVQDDVQTSIECLEILEQNIPDWESKLETIPFEGFIKLYDSPDGNFSILVRNIMDNQFKFVKIFGSKELYSEIFTYIS